MGHQSHTPLIGAQSTPSQSGQSQSDILEGDPCQMSESIHKSLRKSGADWPVQTIAGGILANLTVAMQGMRLAEY